MMWPMRRASLGRAKNCSPASCLPANTSHNRNSAFSLPSLAPMRPTTSACALTTRQSSKRGMLSVPTPFSMKAAWSIGMNSPEDRRSFATTSEISRARSCGSIEPSPAKSGMAIGSGWMVPWVMLSSTTARAGLAVAISAEREEHERQAPRSGGSGIRVAVSGHGGLARASGVSPRDTSRLGRN